MERRRKLDPAGLASGGSALRRTTAYFFTFALTLATTLAIASGQTSDDPAAQEAKTLANAGRWQEIVALAESRPARTPELDYYYGSALAHLERYRDAARILQQGAKRSPQDERFPLELAGVAFRQKQYPQSAKFLRRALDLAPDDPYAMEFLATVYFLEGNLEAALKYWNRLSKPHIENINLEPLPQLNSVLLDHALAFAPASTLTVPQLLASQSMLQGLGIFSMAKFDLAARDDGNFDAVLRNDERDGFGHNKIETLVRLFRDLPSQMVTPEYFNYRHHAINLISMYRWDAQKRRARAELSGPWRGPRRRFFFSGDWRDENWDIRPSFTGHPPLLGSFTLRRSSAETGVTFIPNGRWKWSAAAEFSHREFDNIFLGSALTPELLSQGYQLKQQTDLSADFWRIPEHRIVLTGLASSELGRVWSSPAHAFEKVQLGSRLHWFPQAAGDDYEVLQQFRGGRTWGTPPFDELFTLGGLGDNNLLLRGHITTHSGRKGSGPIGRNYFISNWEMDKNVFHPGFLAVKLGPFMDTGTISDPSPGLGAHKWLWDTGPQLKLKAFGFGMVLTYGRDLRSGNSTLLVGVTLK